MKIEITVQTLAMLEQAANWAMANGYGKGLTAEQVKQLDAARGEAADALEAVPAE